MSEAVIFLVDNGPRTYIVVSRGAFLREDNGILTLGNARNFTYRKCMGYDVGKWGSQREILKGDDGKVTVAVDVSYYYHVGASPRHLETSSF